MSRLRLEPLFASWVLVVACSAPPGPAVTTCPASLTRAGAACVDLSSDPANCGTVGNPCAPDQVCLAGACARTDARCPTGLSACGSSTATACVDLASDGLNCGACGNACVVGRRCSGGECQLACPEPLVACGSGDGAFCTDIRVDGGNCGACGGVCPAGQVCSMGACSSGCAPDLATCGSGASTLCADLRTDHANCGACGNACPTGQGCSAGLCVLSCPQSQVVCSTGAGAFCADIQSDPANCGACESACPAGQGCSAGLCVLSCPQPQVACSAGATAYCADLQSDAANCGACGSACPAGQVCTVGGCVLPCPQSLVACGTGAAAYCADLRSDHADCGACGHPCRPDSACTASRCVAACPEPRLACGGACVDPRSDGVNCGACGVTCPEGRACRDGFCAAPVCSQGAGFPGAPAHPIFGPLALGDVDGDGVLDVAGGSWGGLAVALGNGDGTFRPPVSTAVSSSSSSVSTVLADVDRDGLAEVVASACSENTVSVFHVEAGGALGARVDYAVPYCPEAVVAADLDGDGYVDLAVVTYNSQVGVLRNAGDATFLAPVYYRVVAGAMDLVVADLDGDGHPDLATAGEYAGEVSVLWNDGAGGFEPQALWNVGGKLEGIAAGDVDRDGAIDLVVADSRGAVSYDAVADGSTGAIHVLRNLDHRSFEVSAGPVGGQRVFALALADLDGDRWLDLLAPTWSGTALEVFRGGAGGFAAAERWATGETGIGVAVGDVDGDGEPDVLVGASQYTGSVFLARAELPLEVRGIGKVGAWTVGDLDGDGLVELAVADRAGQGISILRGDGRGGFTASTVLPVPFAPTELLAADLDGDDRLDLVLVNADYGNLRNPGVAVLRNHGGLAFAADATIAVCDHPSHAAARDLDGDGRLDLAVACSAYGGPASVGVLLRRGDAFAVSRYAAVTDGSTLAVGDLDGDGAPDLVMTARSGFAVLRNRGDGTFDAGPEVASCAYPWDTALADLDGDGVVDVVQACLDTMSSEPGFLAVSRGLGWAGFAPPEYVEAGWAPVTVTVGDVDGDGIPDLLATSRNDDTLTVVRGGGGGVFLAPVAYPVGYTMTAPTLVDLDDDGRRDLAVLVAENMDGAYKLMVLPQRCAP